jgi:hypothetical protein
VGEIRSRRLSGTSRQRCQEAGEKPTPARALSFAVAWGDVRAQSKDQPTIARQQTLAAIRSIWFDFAGGPHGSNRCIARKTAPGAIPQRPARHWSRATERPLLSTPCG